MISVSLLGTSCYIFHLIAPRGRINKPVCMYVFTISKQRGFNTRNGYMFEVGRLRTRNRAEPKGIKNNSRLLSNELTKLMPKRISQPKLNQFLLNHF